MTFLSCVAITYTIGTKYGSIIFGKCLDPKECTGLLLLFALNLTIKVLWMALLHGIELITTTTTTKPLSPKQVGVG